MRAGDSYNYVAEAAIPAYSVVKFGSTDGSVVVAAAATDLIIGGNGRIAAAAGDRIDIVRDDFVEMRLGGPVTRGQKLTSDSTGAAIAAAPSAGANVHIVGVAESSGVSGDTIWVFLNASVMQG